MSSADLLVPGRLAGYAAALACPSRSSARLLAGWQLARCWLRLSDSGSGDAALDGGETARLDEERSTGESAPWATEQEPRGRDRPRIQWLVPGS